MKKNLLLAILLGISFASCQNDEITPTQSVESESPIIEPVELNNHKPIRPNKPDVVLSEQ